MLLLRYYFSGKRAINAEERGEMGGREELEEFLKEIIKQIEPPLWYDAPPPTKNDK